MSYLLIQNQIKFSISSFWKCAFPVRGICDIAYVLKSKTAPDNISWLTVYTLKVSCDSNHVSTPVVNFLSFEGFSTPGVDPALFGLFSIFISSFVLIFIWKGFGILFATLNLWQHQEMFQQDFYLESVQMIFDPLNISAQSLKVCSLKPTECNIIESPLVYKSLLTRTCAQHFRLLSWKNQNKLF